MDLSSWTNSIKALETSLDSLDGWITAATLLVVIGLIIEYWHPLTELIDSIKNRPPFPWKQLQEIAGGILVTVGVAGELAFQFKATRVQSQFRSMDHFMQADAELETFRLRMLLGPRFLFPEQIKRLVARLSKLPKIPILFVAYANATKEEFAETNTFAIALRHIFQQAGIDAPVYSAISPSRQITGVYVDIAGGPPPSSLVRTVASEISTALHDAGVQIDGPYPDPIPGGDMALMEGNALPARINTNMVRILIGKKPALMYDPKP